MNTFGKIFFWICVIILGFVSPVISFALIVLYYLPCIVKELCQTCIDTCNENDRQTDYSTEEFITYEENGERVTIRKDQANKPSN